MSQILPEDPCCSGILLASGKVAPRLCFRKHKEDIQKKKSTTFLACVTYSVIQLSDNFLISKAADNFIIMKHIML